MPDYKCKECQEVFENKVAAVIHSVSTKHPEYDLIGTDVKMIVKS
jgi:hypothetical protein